MLALAGLFSSIADDLEESSRIFRNELRSEQPHVRELCEHIEHFRGKQLRPALLLLTGQACGGLRPAHRVLAAVVEMVHIATLVHDDVLDEADVRRRAATVSGVSARGWVSSRIRAASRPGYRRANSRAVYPPILRPAMIALSQPRSSSQARASSAHTPSE